jgi:hypothetical protein
MTEPRHMLVDEVFDFAKENHSAREREVVVSLLTTSHDEKYQNNNHTVPFSIVCTTSHHKQFDEAQESVSRRRFLTPMRNIYGRLRANLEFL